MYRAVGAWLQEPDVGHQWSWLSTWRRLCWWRQDPILHRHQVICLPVDTNAVYQFQLPPWLEKESVLRGGGGGVGVVSRGRNNKRTWDEKPIRRHTITGFLFLNVHFTPQSTHIHVYSENTIAVVEYRKDSLISYPPIPVAAWSKAWICNRSLAGSVGSNPAGGMEVCVLSGRGLCVGLITRPEEYYRLWCVWVWSRILDNEEALDHKEGCCVMVKRNFSPEGRITLTKTT